MWATTVALFRTASNFVIWRLPPPLPPQQGVTEAMREGTAPCQYAASHLALLTMTVWCVSTAPTGLSACTTRVLPNAAMLGKSAWLIHRSQRATSVLKIPVAPSTASMEVPACSTKKKRQLAASVFHHLTQEQTASGPSGATQNSNLVRMVELATKQRFAVNARRVSSSVCFVFQCLLQVMTLCRWHVLRKSSL